MPPIFDIEPIFIDKRDLDLPAGSPPPPNPSIPLTAGPGDAIVLGDGCWNPPPPP